MNLVKLYNNILINTSLNIIILKYLYANLFNNNKKTIENGKNERRT